jgi:hypothetical protein
MAEVVQSHFRQADFFKRFLKLLRDIIGSECLAVLPFEDVIGVDVHIAEFGSVRRFLGFMPKQNFLAIGQE